MTLHEKAKEVINRIEYGPISSRTAYIAAEIIRSLLEENNELKESLNNQNSKEPDNER
jgi:hypothetical protein